MVAFAKMRNTLAATRKAVVIKDITKDNSRYRF